MKKSLVAMLLVLGLLLGGSAFALQADDGIKVMVDGESLEMDVAPVIIDGRTLMPMRAIFEALDADVSWNPEAKRIVGEKFGVVVILHLGEDQAVVNGEEVELDVPAKLVNNRTMVPGRFIAESMGAAVEWDGVAKVVTITSAQEDAPEEERDYIDATGVYEGLENADKVRIEVNGVVEKFSYSPRIEWVFAEMLNSGDEVEITYYEQDGELVLVVIDTVERAGMKKEVEGIFQGMADSQSVEIKVDG